MHLVLGGAQLGSNYGSSSRQFRPVALDLQLLQEATSKGFVAVDTAPTYGVSETMVGEFWGRHVHTKLDSGLDVLTSLKQSLKSLRRSSCDVVYFHDWNVMKNPNEIGKAYDLVVPSYAKRLGVSMYEPDDFDRFSDCEFLEVAQVPFSIVDSRFLAKLENLVGARKRVYARSILFRGLLGKSSRQPVHDALRQRIKDLEDLAIGIDMTLKELSIRWVASLSFLHGIVVGFENATQLREFVGLFRKGPLPPEALAQIRNLEPLPAAAVDLRQLSH